MSSTHQIENVQKNKAMQEELKNIFLIKDTKSTNYRIRKENLCYLAKEQKNNFLGILQKKNQLETILKLEKELS